MGRSGGRGGFLLEGGDAVAKGAGLRLWRGRRVGHVELSVDAE